MEKKTISFLKRSFLGIAVVCLIVFLGMATVLSIKVQNTITQVSEFYMSAMNKQIQQKFSMAIELTSEKLDGVINRTPPDSETDRKELLDALQTSAKVRNFIYLGFCNSDGKLETIYGPDMQILDSDDIMESLAQNNSLAETALDQNGEKCLLLGRVASYPMADGEKSVALVAGVSLDYLSETIFTDTDDTFSHIIDANGDYVIKTPLPGNDGENYLEYVTSELEGISAEDASRYTSELKEAIKNREEYVSTLTVDNETRRVCCVPLSENSTWYLITVMPHGFLDDAITKMDRERMLLMGGASFILLMAMLLVFVQYYRLTQRHVEILDMAKKEASRANESKSVFLSSMSHDIRTPMNAIMGMAEIALKNINDKNRVEDCLKKVQLSGKQLLGLINDILDISKIESGKLSLHVEELSLREVMDEIVSIIKPQTKERGQQFDIFTQDITAEHVWGDEVRLNQILLNLLSNALKFTPEGGHIKVYLFQEPSPEGENHVRTHFQVDDTGIGMSPEFLDKIFDSFERETSNQVHHTSGTGLGMSITKHIVDLMGGTIEVHSKQGQGSSFHVAIDFEKAEGVSKPKQEQTETTSDFTGKRILLAEDNDLNWEIAEDMLSETGLDVERAENGAACVEKLQNSKPGYYSLILMDIQMPIMNGYEATKNIRASQHPDRNIPIVAMTADAFSEDVERCLECGMNYHLSKPLDFGECKRILQQFLNPKDA